MTRLEGLPRRRYDGKQKTGFKEFSEMSATAAVPLRPEVLVQGQFVIPRWVEDLASFRRWRLSEAAPDAGAIAFLDSYIWVDLTMEEFLTHNQVKAAFDYAIMS